jgi:hypothetical protein
MFYVGILESPNILNDTTSYFRVSEIMEIIEYNYNINEICFVINTFENFINSIVIKYSVDKNITIMNIETTSLRFYEIIDCLFYIGSNPETDTTMREFIAMYPYKPVFIAEI